MQRISKQKTYDVASKGLIETKTRKGCNEKLEDEQVVEIFNLAWFSDLKQYQIAERFTIGCSTVSDIKYGKRQSEITHKLLKQHGISTRYCP